MFILVLFDKLQFIEHITTRRAFYNPYAIVKNGNHNAAHLQQNTNFALL